MTSIPLNSGFITRIATQLSNMGFSVYLAKKGNYGFYSNGERCVYFQQDRLGGTLQISGMYSSEKDGTSWQIANDIYDIPEELALQFLATHWPSWASRDPSTRFTTEAEKMRNYGGSLYRKLEKGI